MASRVPALASDCARCLRSASRRPIRAGRSYSSTASTSRPSPPKPESEPKSAHARDTRHSQPAQESPSRSRTGPSDPDTDTGALTRRLEQATEDALLTRSGRRAMEEAGFSESLKARLYAQVTSATPPPSSTIPPVPAAAGAGSRHHATAKPWTGAEAAEDAALRMLDDSKKKLPPDLRARPVVPPVGMAGRGGVSAARRVEGARERAETYRDRDAGLSEREREEVRQGFRERFGPGVRDMPSISVTGLASLANERIEEAMARGQFKDIPRGPGVARDNRVDNPFVDTTEYLMNNMIKGQGLVPPWIEKQQDLVAAAAAFRSALRTSWARHVADSIASRGGALDAQLRRAEAHLRAEAARPRRRNVDQIPAGASSTDDAVFKSRVPEDTTASKSPPEVAGAAEGPFRDPAWEARQAEHVALSVDRLNKMTRSYNLMAPDLAKKAYFSAEREVEGCFGEAAPLVAGELRKRAAGETAAGTGAASLFGGFGSGGGGGGGRAYGRGGGSMGFGRCGRISGSEGR